MEPTGGGQLLLAGSESSRGDGFICDVLAGDCVPASWTEFGDPTKRDWIEALASSGSVLVVGVKVEKGGAPGSICTSSGGTDGFTQLWDISDLGDEVKCAQYATSGPDEIMATALLGDHAFVAGTYWGGGDQDAHLRRYDITHPDTDLGPSSQAITIGSGSGSLEEIFWIALGPELAGDSRMLYFGGRTAGDMVNQCTGQGGLYCTGGPATNPGAADGWVAGAESSAGGLSLRWLYQFAYDGKDNIQNGIYVEHEGQQFLVLNGSVHEEHNPGSHSAPCAPFSVSGDEYSDALLVFMELDSNGDYTGSETIRTAMWGEEACEVGESFQGVAFDAASAEVHVSGTSGGGVDHGGQTGDEDGIYMRYALDLSAANLGTFTRVDAIRIRGDVDAGTDGTDRIYDLYLDGSGAVHLIGDTESTFSQAPWGLPAPNGPVDALYVTFTP